MKFGCIFSLVILFLFLYSTSFSDNVALLHYNKGIELLQQGKTKEAINELKWALKLDKKFAQAHSKLAQIYMEQGTLQGRIKAAREINKALELAPKNTEFNLILGLLMVRQGFIYNAKHQFKRVIKLDPNCAEAYYNLGLLYEDDMLRYKNMISEGGLIQLSGFAKKYQAKAINCFKRALEINPYHRDARFHLGLIYLETGNLDKMVSLFKEMVKQDSLDKDAHLFLGLGLYRLGRHKEANNEYTIAKSLMDEKEREVFDSVEPILSLKEQKEYRRSENKTKFIRSFWKKRDPLFLTEYNERVLEHYSRIAYANLRFGVPKLGIDGYETDRGQIYIRYGEPKIKKKIRPEIENGIFYPTTDVWIYGNFQFVFEDVYSSGNYTFSDAMPGASHIRSRYPGSYTWQAIELRNKMPEIYEYKIKGKKFALPYVCADFRGTNDKSLTKICYGIPSDMIQGAYLLPVEKGLFLFDESWNIVCKNVVKEPVSGILLVLAGKKLFAEEKVFQVKPGNYNLAIEISDPISGNVGAVRQNVFVESYDYIHLQLSDIALILKVVLTGDSTATVMCPTLTYLKSQPINIYYEIYNLHKNQMGRTNYQVNYSIYREPKNNKGLAKLTKRLGKLLGINENRAVVTLSFKGSGTATQKHQNVTIDMTDTDEVEYKLVITLVDLNSGKQTSKEIRLKRID